jgi:hypothetical protein
MPIARVLAFIAALTALGVLLRRFGVLSPAHAPKLSRLAIGVTLPAGIFATLHRFALGAEGLVPAVVMFGLTLVLWAIAELAGRALRLEVRERAVFVLTVVFGNTAFLGYPVCRALFGAEGYAQAVLVDQLGAEPLAVLLGAAVSSHAANAGVVRWGRELQGLVAFPPLLALAAALAWKLGGGPPLPGVLVAALEWVGAATVPIVTIALGLVLRLAPLRAALGTAAVVTVLRLGLSPLLAWGAVRALGLEALASAVTVVEAGMPAMMFTLVLSLRFGLPSELCAGFIALTTLASAATLPVWAVALGR